MSDPAPLLRRAAAQHRLGAWDGAAALYREAAGLAKGAQRAAAHYGLGILALQRGQPELAVPELRVALAEAPTVPDYRFALAQALQRLKLPDEALSTLEPLLPPAGAHPGARFLCALLFEDLGRLAEARALWAELAAGPPPDPDAWFNLALLDKRTGRPAEALAALREAARLRPRQVEAHAVMGELQLEQGRPSEAVAPLTQARQLAPHRLDILRHLGMALRDSGQVDAAIAVFDDALARDARRAELHAARAYAFMLKGQPAAAALGYIDALTQDPTHTHSLNNLAVVLKEIGLRDGASSILERLVLLNPDSAQAHANHAAILRVINRPSAALAAADRAAMLDPNNVAAWANRSQALQDLGRPEEALEAARRAIRLGGASAQEILPAIHSNYLLMMHYVPECTREEILAAHQEFDRLYARPLRPERDDHPNPPDPERRLRLGFISGTFLRHPVTYMTLPFFENYDHAQLHITCYANHAEEHDVTHRLKRTVDSWQVVHGEPDEATARRIRADGIDILFDLSGHSGDNRLMVMARRPAPIQVKWVGGQFNTSGLSAIDWFLSDAVETPPGEERWYVERILRLPDDYICYQPPDYADPPQPPPALASGRITFGSFNNLLKVNPQIVALWARVLHAVPGARLLLKTGNLNDVENRERIESLFAAVGIGADRLDLRGYSRHPELMRTYNEVDIALDTWPYSGGLTTTEALWMGVPVVTLPGPTFAGRHSATHLTAAGLGDWVADSPDAFVALARQAAEDLPRLARLRQGLRAQMLASPLCDGPRFARNFERLMRQVWRDWCAARPATAAAQRGGAA